MKLGTGEDRHSCCNKSRAHPQEGETGTWGLEILARGMEVILEEEPLDWISGESISVSLSEDLR